MIKIRIMDQILEYFERGITSFTIDDRIYVFSSFGTGHILLCSMLSRCNGIKIINTTTNFDPVAIVEEDGTFMLLNPYALEATQAQGYTLPDNVRYIEDVYQKYYTISKMMISSFAKKEKDNYTGNVDEKLAARYAWNQLLKGTSPINEYSSIEFRQRFTVDILANILLGTVSMENFLREEFNRDRDRYIQSEIANDKAKVYMEKFKDDKLLQMHKKITDLTSKYNDPVLNVTFSSGKRSATAKVTADAILHSIRFSIPEEDSAEYCISNVSFKMRRDEIFEFYNNLGISGFEWLTRSNNIVTARRITEITYRRKTIWKDDQIAA